MIKKTFKKLFIKKFEKVIWIKTDDTRTKEMYFKSSFCPPPPIGRGNRQSCGSLGPNVMLNTKRCRPCWSTWYLVIAPVGGACLRIRSAALARPSSSSGIQDTQPLLPAPASSTALIDCSNAVSIKHVRRSTGSATESNAAPMEFYRSSSRAFQGRRACLVTNRANHRRQRSPPIPLPLDYWATIGPTPTTTLTAHERNKKKSRPLISGI